MLPALLTCSDKDSCQTLNAAQQEAASGAAGAGAGRDQGAENTNAEAHTEVTAAVEAAASSDAEAAVAAGTNTANIASTRHVTAAEAAVLARFLLRDEKGSLAFLAVRPACFLLPDYAVHTEVAGLGGDFPNGCGAFVHGRMCRLGFWFRGLG